VHRQGLTRFLGRPCSPAENRLLGKIAPAPEPLVPELQACLTVLPCSFSRCSRIGSQRKNSSRRCHHPAYSGRPGCPDWLSWLAEVFAHPERAPVPTPQFPENLILLCPPKLRTPAMALPSAPRTPASAGYCSRLIPCRKAQVLRERAGSASTRGTKAIASFGRHRGRLSVQ
jgi:hypothetical protein